MNSLRVILLVVIFAAILESVEMKKKTKSKHGSKSSPKSKSKSSTCRSCEYSGPECTHTYAPLDSINYIDSLSTYIESECQNVCNLLLECKRFAFSTVNPICYFYSDEINLTLELCNSTNSDYRYYDEQVCDDE